MSTPRLVLISVLIALVAILLLSSLYVVEVKDFALVTQFGRVVATRTEPGLYLKIPLIQSVEMIDRRLREWDGEPSNLNTAEKQKVVINTWARWRVTDPKKFYEALRTEGSGQGVLDGLIDSSVKNVISARPLMEALRNTNRRLKYREKELEDAEAARDVRIELGRDKVVDEILKQAQTDTEEKYGFKVEGVAVKSFNYVSEIVPTIYQRMRSERIRISNLYESEGREKEAEILGDMAKELEQIESQAMRKATIVRGEADAEVTRIYAEAYGRDAEFYSFIRTLELYRTSLGDGTRLILSTKESELFRFLQSSK